jgi:signal transduction histidine kinase
MLEEMGLKSAILWYLDGFSTRSGIKATLDVRPDFDRLSRDSELAFFRVLQESLTNIHRHSGSATAHVRLSTREGIAILEIKDQGKGIAPGLQGHSSQGFVNALGVGLRGMKERMLQLGGSFEVVSTEEGTTVTATVPSAVHKSDAVNSIDSAIVDSRQNE